MKFTYKGIIWNEKFYILPGRKDNAILLVRKWLDKLSKVDLEINHV